MNEYPENYPKTSVDSDRQVMAEADGKQQSPKPSNNSTPLWQRPKQFWNDIPLRTKISLLLVTGATIPVVAATQGIVKFTQNELLSNLQDSLDTKLILIEEEIALEKRKLENNAHGLALAVEAAEINLNNTDSVQSNNQKLESFIAKTKVQNPDANFYIITDSQGRTVAQSLQQVNYDGEEYPLLPAEAGMDRAADNSSSTQFESIQLNKGINLKKLDIVNDSLQLSRPLSGFELLSNDVLKSLGLAKQADIGIRNQKIEGLAEPEKPYPEKEFKIDRGKAGLVLMAVETIELGNNEVGTAVVGTLINRNFDIVDRLKNIANVSTATIFAQDWRVSSNVPYTDNKTRAIGTRVSRTVADAVLKQGEVYRGNANIIGTEYQTGYAPIFNHEQQIDSESAKPIGIAYVGEPLTQINANLTQIALIGYAIGAIILIIIVAIILLSPLVKSISRPIKELTEFATKITDGNTKIRLESNPRRDEIGVLAQNLNEMAQSIDANLEARQKETEQQRQGKEQLELAIYTLIDEISDATDGDLTVRANLDSLELSTVADLFNAIIDNLQEIAIEAKESSSLVGSSLQKNEQSIRKLAEQAIAEAEETRNTLLSVEQMAQSIKTVATNASQAEQIADDTYNTVLNSSNDMDSTVDSILNLRTTVSDTANKMQRLSESSEKISQAVSLIEEIALKTNVLAINAGAEADRAGEYGQGFSVVAEQVGALAEQSKAAVKEIASVVMGIQAETKEVRQAMESGATQVINTTRLVENTKQSLAQVLEKSQTINQLMESISESTESQANTSQNVTSLMQKIAQLSAITSQSSTEVARSIGETARVAQKLESTVSQFKVADS